MILPIFDAAISAVVPCLFVAFIFAPFRISELTAFVMPEFRAFRLSLEHRSHLFEEQFTFSGRENNPWITVLISIVYINAIADK